MDETGHRWALDVDLCGSVLDVDGQTTWTQMDETGRERCGLWASTRLPGCPRIIMGDHKTSWTSSHERGSPRNAPRWVSTNHLAWACAKCAWLSIVRWAWSHVKCDMGAHVTYCGCPHDDGVDVQ